MTANDAVKNTPGNAAAGATAQDTPREKPTIDEAKRRFIEAMHGIDVLEPLRKHPYVVVGSAVAAGAVLGSSGKVVVGLSGLVASLARLIKPLGGILAQLAAAKLAANAAADQAADAASSTDVNEAASAQAPT